MYIHFYLQPTTLWFIISIPFNLIFSFLVFFGITPSHTRFIDIGNKGTANYPPGTDLLLFLASVGAIVESPIIDVTCPLTFNLLFSELFLFPQGPIIPE